MHLFLVAMHSFLIANIVTSFLCFPMTQVESLNRGPETPGSAVEHTWCFSLASCLGRPRVVSSTEVRKVVFTGSTAIGSKAGCRGGPNTQLCELRARRVAVYIAASLFLVAMPGAPSSVLAPVVLF